MAVNPAPLPDFYPVPGVRLGTADAAIKKPGSDDLVVIELAEGSAAGAVFTRNAFRAAPVLVAEQALAAGRPRYLLINTGNANAGTGEQGLADARSTCAALADLTGVDARAVLPFSTGVIGEPLPVARIEAALAEALSDLKPDNWARAAAGIMTTDTRPKAASRQLDIGGHTVTVTGMAKGAGMIKPDMATMLAYVATDAPVAATGLQNLLSDAVERSFNRISVDGDTSTNDACMLVATGQAPLEPLQPGTDAFNDLAEALTAVCIELAQGLVRDGEGASKFVTLAVGGARDEAEALRVAYTIAESPLVKTALFASDPNWGRLLAAIGRAGVPELDVERVSIRLNDVLIAERGCRAAGYTEAQGAAAMAAEDITIAVELDRGDSAATVWTSDLSHEYVRINAEYRT